MHPYVAQQPDELTLELADILNILEKTEDGEARGWAHLPPAPSLPHPRTLHQSEGSGGGVRAPCAEADITRLRLRDRLPNKRVMAAFQTPSGQLGYLSLLGAALGSPGFMLSSRQLLRAQEWVPESMYLGRTVAPQDRVPQEGVRAVLPQLVGENPI